MVLVVVSAGGLGGCLGGGGGGAGAPFGGAGSEFSAQAGLSHIAAAAPSAAGYTGEAVRVGIVDSGVDGSHSEFGNRVTAGGDWQGSGNGLSDPNGHGTHVASIVGAASDGVGMQGVAPEAELYSYRILDSAGRMAGQTSEAIMPDVVNRMRQHRLQIVNNSWGSGVAIDDVPAETISSALPRELSAWSDALLAAFMLLNVGEQYVPAELFDQEEQTGLNQDGWLTGRERDVLNGLLSGKSNKEIALAYGLSEVTIKHHLKNLRSKLGARNRTHAVCRAIELGLADEYSVSA